MQRTNFLGWTGLKLEPMDFGAGGLTPCIGDAAGKVCPCTPLCPPVGRFGAGGVGKDPPCTPRGSVPGGLSLTQHPRVTDAISQGRSWSCLCSTRRCLPFLQYWDQGGKWDGNSSRGGHRRLEPAGVEGGGREESQDASLPGSR